MINKEELLQRWMVAYEDKLKLSKLHIGTFRFINENDQSNWKNLNLGANKTFWGGEPAGAIITKYLNPEIYTLYTTETRNDLIKNYKLVPDPKGKDTDI